MKNEITPYLEIRDRITTFTIINCEHRNILWRMIGHTAVVYKCQDTGQLMVLESVRGIGVRLMPMGKWVAEYDGSLFIRIPKYYAHMSLGPNGIQSAKDKAPEFIMNHLGSSYPNLKTRTGRMKLYLAALDLKMFGRDWLRYEGIDAGIFCTMLVVMFFQFCGLMEDTAYANEFEPDDTRDGAKINLYARTVIWDAEIQIK